LHEIRNNDVAVDRDTPVTPVTDSAQSNGSVRPPVVSLCDFEARIRRYNADLEPTSLAYRAAVILLAGQEFGHNIDRIARRTGYPGSLVSQVARRLIDNGVWNAGVTVADWSGSEHASGSFWNDVAVAEGKMCRRIGPGGSIEWAPAGFWNKSFQFVDPEADNSLSTLYHDAGASPTGEATADGEPTVDAETDGVVAGSELIGLLTSGPGAHQHDSAVTLIGGSNGNGSPVVETEIIGPAPARPAVLPAAVRGRTTVPALDDLFSDTVWIG